MKTWEYTYVHVSDTAVEDNLTITILNGYGAHGWEFTGLVEEAFPDGYDYLMKRVVWKTQLDKMDLSKQEE